MKIKTTELQGEALAWAVADCEGELSQHGGQVHLVESKVRFYEDTLDIQYTPSTAWAQGGPIIEREGIALDCLRTCFVIDSWVAASEMVREGDYDSPVIKFTGPTPLIAAMRCYVASEMGEEVEVPDELQGEIA